MNVYSHDVLESLGLGDDGLGQLHYDSGSQSARDIRLTSPGSYQALESELSLIGPMHSQPASAAGRRAQNDYAKLLRDEIARRRALQVPLEQHIRDPNPLAGYVIVGAVSERVKAVWARLVALRAIGVVSVADARKKLDAMSRERPLESSPLLEARAKFTYYRGEGISWLTRTCPGAVDLDNPTHVYSYPPDRCVPIAQATAQDFMCQSYMVDAENQDSKKRPFARYAARVQCARLTLPQDQSAAFVHSLKKPRIRGGFFNTVFGRVLRGVGMVALNFIPGIGTAASIVLSTAVGVMDKAAFGTNYYQPLPRVPGAKEIPPPPMLPVIPTTIAPGQTDYRVQGGPTLVPPGTQGHLAVQDTTGKTHLIPSEIGPDGILRPIAGMNPILVAAAVGVGVFLMSRRKVA